MGYFKHGMYRTPEYQAWISIKARCYNPNSRNYKNYGGRGISMCSEWDADFMAFYEHIGPRPSDRHSIDRIDVNGHYEPGNVRWTTWDVQAVNKRPRTVCRNGLHEMTEANTLGPGYGHHRCRACYRARTLRPQELKPCGTPAAYQRHRINGERPCDACREADNAHRRARAAARREGAA